MAEENFNDGLWTEVDIDGNFVEIYSNTATRWRNTEQWPIAYIYKDFGANWFKDFKVNFTTNWNGASSSGSRAGGCVFSNNLHITLQDGIDNNRNLGHWVYRSGATRRYYLQDWEAGNNDYHNYGNEESRYNTMQRVGTTATLEIYTDAARTILEDTLTVTCTTTWYQYCAAVCSRDYGASSEWIHGYIRNMEFIPTNTVPSQPTNPSPSDGQSDVTVGNVTLEVDVSDPDSDAMDVYFYDASDDSLIGVDYAVPSGSTATIVWANLLCGQTKSWYAIADDGLETTSSATFTFYMYPCPLNYPLKEKTDYKYKYKVKNTEGKYKEAIKDKYKYRAKTQR